MVVQLQVDREDRLKSRISMYLQFYIHPRYQQLEGNQLFQNRKISTKERSYRL